MLKLVASLFNLLFGMSVLLTGVGLLGSLLGIRAGLAGFSSEVTGVVMAAYFAGYILGTYLCPRIIRRVGHVRAFTIFAALGSTVSIAHALWVDPWFWGALRFVNGAGMVGLYMVMESWLNTTVSNEGRGRLFSTYVMSTLLAMGLGQLLLTVGPVQSFVPFALVSMLFSLGLIPVALTRVPQPTPIEHPSLNLRHLVGFSPLGTVGTLTAGLTSGTFWALGAVFGHGIGLSTGHIGAFMAASIAGGAFLQWPLGKLSDRFDRRTVLLFVCAGGALLALAIAAVGARSLPLLLSIAFVYGGFSFTLYGISVAHMNDQIRVEDMLEASSGLLMLYGIGAVIGPVLGGVLMSHLGSASLPVYLAAAFALLGLFGLYRNRVSDAPPLEEQGEFVPLVRTSQAAIELSHPEATAADAGEETPDRQSAA
ncbi:hypothetical protein BJI67_04455 [Acidihalobacter aeolianus]|uniref:Major facilitator superfamily (MFS) profile domain-containing protein n=1 Tax=Acidihalobacter aeolianus TaxID=2792603 RepID=A0A1D8K630_9GAMM|nr:MFS transporter [Acidihalobacter aeolianus]AOV16419.1 hypothetical protein BJI67_04455 [Acidihalobacter aeolianus]